MNKSMFTTNFYACLFRDFLGECTCTVASQATEYYLKVWIFSVLPSTTFYLKYKSVYLLLLFY